MKVKCAIFTALFLLLQVTGFAQSAVYVSDFAIASNDTDSQESGIVDKKGLTCALLKIMTPESDIRVSSESGPMVRDVKSKDMVWAYAPSGTRTITILSGSGKTIASYETGFALKSGKTYLMTLTRVEEKSVSVAVHDAPAERAEQKSTFLLRFDVSPASATLTVNGQNWNLDAEGSAAREVMPGTYSYRITAADYTVAEGKVSVDGTKENYFVNEYLIKKVGWVYVTIPEGMDYAEAYIDGNYMGTLPLKAQLGAGKHKVLVTKYLYKPHEQEFEILEKSTQTIVPILELGFAKNRLSVPADADIFVDGEFKGTRSWEGALSFGKHTVECRQDGCRPSETTIEVSETSKTSIMLDAPKQVFGSLDVITDISGVSVLLDDKLVGTTPLHLVGNVPIGDRMITLQKDGCVTQDATVAILENETAEVRVTMERITEVHVTSSPSKAALVIDGDYVGMTPFTTVLKEGNHSFSATAKNAYPVAETRHTDASSSEVFLRMKRQLQLPNAIYIEGDVLALGYLGAGACIGGFVKNVNLEAGFMMGLSESDVIYWNSPSDMTKPTGYAYKPMYYGGKVGYGIILGTRFRITPQVGTGLLSVHGTVKEKGADDPGTTDAYAVPVVADVRFDVALAPYIGLSLCPGYSVAVVKSDLFNALAQASKTISGYATGINLKAGLYIYF